MKALILLIPVLFFCIDALAFPLFGDSTGLELYPQAMVEKNFGGDVDLPQSWGRFSTGKADLFSVGAQLEWKSFFLGASYSREWLVPGEVFSPFEENFALAQSSVFGGFNLRGIDIYLGSIPWDQNDNDFQCDLPFFAGLAAGRDFDKFHLEARGQFQTGTFRDLSPFVVLPDVEFTTYSAVFSATISEQPVSPIVQATVEMWDMGAEMELAISLGFGFTYGGSGSSPKFHSRRLQRSASSGQMVYKPNVYLYPETPTQVEVTVIPDRGITCSIPQYEDGWRVLANPDGSIAGTEGFLFYEGEVSPLSAELGWSVPYHNLKKFFEEKLIAYGFNTKERNEFSEFWTAKLRESKYYNIFPITNEGLSKVCPLTVDPAPDKILRLWFLFQAKSDFDQLSAPEIPVFSREGFVVTEWGGIILEN